MFKKLRYVIEYAAWLQKDSTGDREVCVKACCFPNEFENGPMELTRELEVIK